MKTDPHQEIFDVVNERDEVIGQDTRSNVHKNKLFHRAVHILVFDSAGRIYLQKRSMTKDVLPGRWTTSCSGHVDSGEDYDQAAVREIHEELSIALDSAQELNLLFAHHPIRDTGWEFIKVYALRWDGTIIPDPDEISEGKWLEPEKLTDWIADTPDDFAHSFRLVWKLAQDFLPLS